MKLKLFCLLCVMASAVFALSQSEISTSINDLSVKINQITQDLNKKQQAQKAVDTSLGVSEHALQTTQQNLNKLKAAHDTAVTQSQQIAQMITIVTADTQTAESSVQQSIVKIYQQLNLLQNKSNSILSGNDQLQTERKHEYLLHLLKAEQNKYVQLQGKLKQLNNLSKRLAQQVQRLNAQMAQLEQKNHQLKVDTKSKLAEKQALSRQIISARTEIGNLKQAQAELNRLMTKIAKAHRTHNIVPGNGMQVGAADTSYEDHSPFLARKLAKPVDGDVAIAFGDMRNGVRSNGVLFKTTDTDVHAISGGKVVYLGELPGFGHIIVVDHGDNYVAIYGGVIPGAKRGDKVTAGQTIANAGGSGNQPMGGVYFELRHLGRPVNPSSLL